MLENIKPNRILFLDIETASIVPEFKDLTLPFQEQFKEKFHRLYEAKEEPVETYFKNEAGLHAAFAKIVTCVIGKIVSKEEMKLELVTIANKDEHKILAELCTYLNKMPEDVIICSFNGTEFDWPFICRRLLVAGMSIPSCLDFMSKKPWARNCLDPLEVWRFGSRHQYIKLELLALLLGLQSPKEELKGEDVSKCFWHDPDGLTKIAAYCRKDVQTLANIVLKLKGMNPILDEKVVVKQ